MADSAEPGDLQQPAETAKATAEPARVFVSYASADKPIADAVCAALEAAGIPCWIAPRDVKPGALYADAIVRAITNAKALVLVLSENAIASSHVGKEVERASSKKRPIIALRIDTAPLTPALEYFLSESQWIDATAADRRSACAKLVGAIGEPRNPMSKPFPPLATSLVSAPKARRKLWMPGLAAVGLAAIVIVGTRLVLLGHTTAEPPRAAPLAISDKSLAVLPFTDMSEKKDQDYFADGMAEEVLDLLANIPGLRVISRTSSFQFKGKSLDVRTVGKTLGVSYLVEGTVRKSGDRLRVTAQLIDARDGSQLWSDTYDEPIGDALDVQDRIASNLARALQVSVGSDYQLARPFKSPEEYDLYLRGRHAADRNDKEGYESAAAYFQQILELDPASIPAVEWLARVQLESAEMGYVELHGGVERARLSAQRALALDPKSSAAHATLSSVHVYYDWDWAAAERDAEEAIRVKPRDSVAVGNLGKVYVALGRWDEAARLLKTALTLDPLFAEWYVGLGNVQVATGRLHEAEASSRKALQISPTFGEGHLDLGEVLLLEGDFHGALAEMQQEQTESARYVGLAMAYHALGRRAESDAALAQVVHGHAQDDASEIADAYAYRGELDQAFEWLGRAYSQKDDGLWLIKCDPFLKKDDPRYKAFLRKMNLPE